MTFIDDIQKTEKEAQSILDKARDEAENIRQLADTEREKALCSLNAELSVKEKNSIANVEKNAQSDAVIEISNSKKKIEEIETQASKNKNKAVDFVLNNLQR